MKLIDLLQIINDNENIIVANSNGYIVSEYNGRDSIDEKYNDCKVLQLCTFQEYILIHIYEYVK